MISDLKRWIFSSLNSKTKLDAKKSWVPSQERSENDNKSKLTDVICCNLNKDYKMIKQWENIQKELDIRREVLFNTATNLQKENAPNSFILASVDVFIEKAQINITNKALKLWLLGASLSFFALILLMVSGYYTYKTDVVEIVKSFKELNTLIVTLLVLKSTTVTAFILSAVWYCISLARALFHESTILLNRRHALRFGRLYAYTKQGDITWEEMERAFNWNIESSTAFKDIKPDNMAKPLATALAQMPIEVAKALKGKGNDQSDK